MDKKKWIKEIIGDCIEKYGFLYEGCAREGDIRMYSFVKKDKDLCKVSWIGCRLWKSNYKKVWWKMGVG